MAILRDGLVMIHGAAHDPSLLKPITNYSITDLQTGWLKVAVPAGADLLQVGQSVSFQKNEGTGYFANSSGDRINDGSIWYIEDIQKHEVSAILCISL